MAEVTKESVEESPPVVPAPEPKGPSPFWRIPLFRRPGDLRTRYAEELRIFQTGFARTWIFLLLVALAAIPFFLTDFWISVINAAAIAAIGAIGLNILTGYTGQVSLGHAFFIGLGAYTAGYLGADLNLPVIVWLPAAGVLGAVVGAIIGPFALRLKGLYLAIVTLGLVFVGQHLFLTLRNITGGPQGRAIPSPRIGNISFADLQGSLGLPLNRDQSLYFFLIPLLVLATLFAKNVVRSRAGRAFQAIRDREIAAAVIGVNPARYKVAAFVLSSFYASVAGALFGSYVRYVIPGQFNLLLSIQYVAMIIVGGVGTIFGAILGALFIVMIPRVVQQLSPYIPFVSQTAVGAGLNVFTLNQIIFGALIVFFLVFEPRGLAGIWLRLKIYFKSWPFSY